MQGFWSKKLFLNYPLMGEKKRNLQALGILLLQNITRILLDQHIFSIYITDNSRQILSKTFYTLSISVVRF